MGILNSQNLVKCPIFRPSPKSVIISIIKWIINGKSYYKQEDNSQPAEISQPENENRQPDVSSSFIKTLLVTITLIILLLLGILLS